jgi:hypothetical protein
MQKRIPILFPNNIVVKLSMVADQGTGRGKFRQVEVTQGPDFEAVGYEAMRFEQAITLHYRCYQSCRYPSVGVEHTDARASPIRTVQARCCCKLARNCQG